MFALNLRRGASLAGYVARLTPFAIVSQPIYRAAFHDGLDNILITLLLAGIVAILLDERSKRVQHAVFAVGAAAAFARAVDLDQHRPVLRHGRACCCPPRSS